MVNEATTKICQSKVGQAAFKLCMFGGLVAVLLSIASFFGTLSPAVDLFSHFRWQYVWFFMFVAILSAAFRQWLYATTFATACFVNAALLAILWCPVTGHRAPPGTHELRLLDMNLYCDNRQYKRVAAQIEKYNPDVIVVEELTPEMFHLLQPALKAYPFHVCSMRTDPYGIGIMSKQSFRDVNANVLSTQRSYLISSKLQVGKNVVTIVGIHVLPEMSADDVDTDNLIIEGLKAFADRNANPIIVVGDFNATPWSALFHRLLHAGHFIDSERGFGLQPSWPFGVGMLMIPIDHCLTTADCNIISRSTGDFIGSDHVPLFVRIAIADE